MKRVLIGKSVCMETQCPDCGRFRMVDHRRVGTPCKDCAPKRRITHGLSEHPLYRIHAGLKARCTYAGSEKNKYYGGRGIGVCQEWLNSPEKFVKWAADLGWRKGLEVDRIDVNGDYSPENCRLLDHATNSRLRRNARCTIEQAREVKEQLAAGGGVRAVAVAVGVPYMTVWHISKGNTWRDV